MQKKNRNQKAGSNSFPAPINMKENETYSTMGSAVQMVSEDI